MQNLLKNVSGTTDHEAYPHAAIYFSPELPSVHLIAKPGVEAVVSHTLQQLNYRLGRQSSIDAFPAAQTDNESSIVIIDGSIASFIWMAKEHYRDIPKILITDDASIQLRVLCARANIDAVVLVSDVKTELIEWIEHFSRRQATASASILIVDDDELISHVYAEQLRSDGTFVQIENDPAAILTAIGQMKFDLIILDLQMPGINGIELAKVIRQSRKYISIPILFLSAEQNPDVQLTARMQGCDDFLSKRIDLATFQHLVRVRVERARTLSALIERDGLTGLLNHSHFKERITHEFARARRTRSTFSLAMIDIDHFKQVNDSFGHQTGDHVLSTLSRALVNWLRRTDFVGRYGGEEFAVLLLDTAPENAAAVIESFRAYFSTIIFCGGSDNFSVTLSGGIAGSAHWCDTSDLVAAADHALYEAKRGGRNRILLHSGCPHSPSLVSNGKSNRAQRSL